MSVLIATAALLLSVQLLLEPIVFVALPRLVHHHRHKRKAHHGGHDVQDV